MCTAAVCYQMEVVYTLSSPRGPAGTSRLHEEVAQMPVASTLINTAVDAKHSHKPHEVFPVIVWLRKRRLGLSLQMALHMMQALPRNGQLEHYSFFLGQP